MLGSDVRRRLSSSLDRCVAANAIQFAIGLVNCIRIKAVTAGRHASVDQAVSKGDQVNAKELRSAFNHSKLRFPFVEGLRRSLEHSQKRVAKLRRSRIADKIPLAHGRGEMRLLHTTRGCGGGKPRRCA